MATVVLQCPACGKGYRVDLLRAPPGITSFPCKVCGKPVPLDLGKSASAQSPTILVVVEETELSALIIRILHRGSYRGQVVRTGEQAVRLVSAQRPDALLISVVLPDMMGYEVISSVRSLAWGPGLPILLLPSAFRASRFKRTPTSLYGADDYVEQHHLPDTLLGKLRKIMGAPGRVTAGEKETPASPDQAAPPSDEEVDERRELETFKDRIFEAKGESLGRQVQRMARIIVADLALYNEALLDGPSPGELREKLGPDILEGKKLLQRRYPGFSGDCEAVLLEELTRLVRMKRGEGTKPGGEESKDGG